MGDVNCADFESEDQSTSPTSPHPTPQPSPGVPGEGEYLCPLRRPFRFSSSAGTINEPQFFIAAGAPHLPLILFGGTHANVQFSLVETRSIAVRATDADGRRPSGRLRHVHGRRQPRGRLQVAAGSGRTAAQIIADFNATAAALPRYPLEARLDPRYREQMKREFSGPDQHMVDLITELETASPHDAEPLRGEKCLHAGSPVTLRQCRRTEIAHRFLQQRGGRRRCFWERPGCWR